MKKHISIAIILGMLFTGIGMLIKKDSEFSPYENKFLSMRPSFTMQSFLDGSFVSDATSWADNQIPFRETFVSFSNNAKLLTGDREINDAYIGKEGRLFERILDKDIDVNNLKRNLKWIENLKEGLYHNPNIEKPVEIYFMGVPSAGNVLSGYLPQNASMYDYKELMNTIKAELIKDDNGGYGIKIIDIYDDLKDVPNAYYKTDHHWTDAGVRIGYGAFWDAFSMEEADTYIESYKDNKHINKDNEGRLITKEFLGTLHSKTLIYGQSPDEIYAPNINSGISVIIDGKESEMYHEDFLKTKDKYGYFLGGNHGLTVIKNSKNMVDKAKETRGNILVIKDSFANSFVPYLTNDFDEIYMVDPRYYSGNVKDLIEEQNIERVLFLFELSGFAETKEFIRL